jgi:hypothetical protein
MADTLSSDGKKVVQALYDAIDAVAMLALVIHLSIRVVG